MAKLTDPKDQPQNFKTYEPKQNARFICEIVEVDSDGNEVRGIPSYVVFGISDIESTKSKSTYVNSDYWLTHRFTVDCYLPVVPMVEEIAYKMLDSTNVCKVTIKDLGPVGDIVSEKIYSNCRIEGISKSNMYYNDETDDAQILSIKFVSKHLTHSFDYVV